MEAYTKTTSGTITVISRASGYRANGVPYTPQYSQLQRDYARVLNGYKNPKWRDQISKGLGATTPMQATDVVYDLKTHPVAIYSDKDAVGDNQAYGYSDSMTQFMSWTGSETLDTSLQTTVINGASQKLYEKISAFNGLTALGELRETLELLRNPALALRAGVTKLLNDHKGIRKVVSGITVTRDGVVTSRLRPIGKPLTRLQKLSVYRDAIANSWLEHSFGWRPLIRDIEDAKQAYNEVVKNLGITRVTARYTSHKRVPNTLLTTSGYLASPLVSVNFDVFRNQMLTSGCNISAGLQTDISTDVGLVDTFGLWPENFIPAAWELLPWSFLIDYFTNIGDVLGCWATAQRVGFSFVAQTVRHEARFGYSTRLRSHATPYTKVVSNGTCTVTKKSVSRSSLASVPIPSLTVSAKMGTSRILNIAALANGFLSDRRISRVFRDLHD